MWQRDDELHPSLNQMEAADLRFNVSIHAGGTVNSIICILWMLKSIKKKEMWKHTVA